MSLLSPPIIYNNDIEEGVNTNDFLNNDVPCLYRYSCGRTCHEIDWISILSSSYLKWIFVSLFMIFFVIGLGLAIYQKTNVLSSVCLIISLILAFFILLFIIITRVFFQLEN
jgi:hypothetical protein